MALATDVVVQMDVADSPDDEVRLEKEMLSSTLASWGRFSSPSRQGLERPTLLRLLIVQAVFSGKATGRYICLYDLNWMTMRVGMAYSNPP